MFDRLIGFLLTEWKYFSIFANTFGIIIKMFIKYSNHSVRKGNVKTCVTRAVAGTQKIIYTYTSMYLLGNKFA